MVDWFLNTPMLPILPSSGTTIKFCHTVDLIIFCVDKR